MQPLKQVLGVDVHDVELVCRKQVAHDDEDDACEPLEPAVEAAQEAEAAHRLGEAE